MEAEVNQWPDDSGKTRVWPTQPARHRSSRPESPGNTNLSTSRAKNEQDVSAIPDVGLGGAGRQQ